MFLKKKKVNFINQLINLSFFIFIFTVIGITLLPIPTDPRLIQSMIETKTQAHNNFIPFSNFLNAMDYNALSLYFRQIAGNTLLLLPLGFYAPLIWPKVKGFKTVILIGISCTIGIELLQVLISKLIGVTYRSFDVDDIIFNTIGIIVGYFVLKLTSLLLKNVFRNLDDDNKLKSWNFGR